MNVCMYVRVCACVCMCVCACVCVYACVCVHLDIHQVLSSCRCIKVVRKVYASSKTSIFEEFEILFFNVLYETPAIIIFQLIIIKQNLL